jgi:hypothetical protein
MDLDKPEYRVRLFLSVDLTGSTDFKARTGHTSLVWLKAFQKFYGEFPSIFARNYQEACTAIPDIGVDENVCTPKVWKTIGDRNSIREPSGQHNSSGSVYFCIRRNVERFRWRHL